MKKKISSPVWAGTNIEVDKALVERAEKMQTRRKYKDYLEAYLVTPKSVKYVTDLIIKDRRVCLRGIDICICAEGSKVSVDPVIPCVGPLLQLLKANPKLDDITFKGKKWYPTWKEQRIVSKGGK